MKERDLATEILEEAAGFILNGNLCEVCQAQDPDSETLQVFQHTDGCPVGQVVNLIQYWRQYPHLHGLKPKSVPLDTPYSLDVVRDQFRTRTQQERTEDSEI